MKVNELIKQLQKYGKNLPVYIDTSAGEFEIYINDIRKYDKGFRVFIGDCEKPERIVIDATV